MKMLRMNSPEIEFSFKIINMGGNWVLNKKLPNVSEYDPNPIVWEIIKQFETKLEAVEYMNNRYGTTIAIFENVKSSGNIYATIREDVRERLLKRITGHLVKGIKSNG